MISGNAEEIVVANEDGIFEIVLVSELKVFQIRVRLRFKCADQCFAAANSHKEHFSPRLALLFRNAIFISFNGKFVRPYLE